MSAVRTAKKALLSAARSAGGFTLARNSPWRTNRLLILCYHGISKEDEHEWNPGLYLRPETFRRRMEILRDGRYNVLDLSEGLKRLENGTLPPRGVAITFDDGAHDFYSLAWPVLREFGFASTLYLTTYYCLHQLPVFDVVCSYILWKGRNRTFAADGILKDRTGPVTLSDWRTVNRTLYRQVRDEDMSAQAKDALAEELARRLNVDYQHIRDIRLLYLMRPEEVREVSKNGVRIDLHTHRHRTPRNRELFEREIEQNRAEIIQMTGINPVHFCYPSGDYVPEYFEWLRGCGVHSATTCVTGLAEKSSDLWELPRLLDVETLSDLEFEGWLTGFSAFLPGRG